MKISIAICTWNRSRLLAQTLERISQLQIPPEVALEVVVVNNNSTDETSEVITSFANRIPIKAVNETEQGHSFARNRAIESCQGDIIIWTDDDVLVGDDWLAEYYAGISNHPDAAYFGGPIIPVFEVEEPHWLKATWQKCKPAFAARDLGDESFQFGEGQFPYGANFAVRTEIQREFLFDSKHGRKGQGMMGDDEIAVLRRIANAGHGGVWLPKTKVEHFITPDRMTPEYIGRYFAGRGEANIISQRQTMNSRFHAFRVALHNLACFRIKQKFADPDVWVSHLIRGSIAWGEYRMLKQVN